jgi:hypothetical protein
MRNNTSHNTSHCADRTTAAAASADKYERFEAWLRENGARFDMVRRWCVSWSMCVCLSVYMLCLVVSVCVCTYV